MLTGIPRVEETTMVLAAMRFDEAPWAYVSWVFPIFSPMVTTILFHPIMVPIPRATDTSRITHRGASEPELARWQEGFALHKAWGGEDEDFFGVPL